jgi:hypothetical protein
VNEYDEYRRQAVCCQRAAKCNRPDLKAEWLRLARNWLEMVPLNHRSPEDVFEALLGSTEPAKRFLLPRTEPSRAEARLLKLLRGRAGFFGRHATRAIGHVLALLSSVCRRPLCKESERVFCGRPQQLILDFVRQLCPLFGYV